MSIRRSLASLAAFGVAVAVVSIAPPASADEQLQGVGVAHGGIYVPYEADVDLDALAAATGKRATFGGTFNSIFFNASNLDRIWKGKATPFVNVEVPGASAYRLARGDYDAQIAWWVDEVKKYLDLGGGRSAIIAPFQEMNGNWVSYGCEPAYYADAFRRFVDAFRKAGIDETQIRFAFAPNGWTSIGCGEIADYYPGDGYVDILGISAYNWGWCASTGWESPAEAFGPWLDELRAINAFKPFLIMQTAAPRVGCGGNQDQWVKDMQTYVANDPNLVGFVWFNFIKEHDWRVWYGGTATNGWTTAMNRSSTLYQWPLTNWFQPGTLTVGIPAGPGDRVTVLGGTAAVQDGVRFQIVSSLGGLPARLSGSNRYATAAAISKAHFPSGISRVYVATGEGFADALALGPAAALHNAPLLLVKKNSLPAETAAELARLKPGQIILAGGAAVISTGVEDALKPYASTVTRIAGAHRYDTAARVSAAHFAPGVRKVFVTTGANFPDALSAGAGAAALSIPVVLTDSASLPAEARNELIRLAPSKIVIVGGTGVVSTNVENQLNALGVSVTRIAGANRYATSAAVSAYVFSPGVDNVLLATGVNYPDALAAVALAGKLGAPLLLTDPANLPGVIDSELHRLLD